MAFGYSSKLFPLKNVIIIAGSFDRFMTTYKELKKPEYGRGKISL
jgi:hypothetical protein